MSVLDDVEQALKELTKATRYGPKIMYVRGGLLNRITESDEYDERKTYLVTEEGIGEV